MNKLNDSEYLKAKEYVFRSLTCHDQTEWEIRRKLKQRGYQSETADAVIALLQEYNYINDLRYTEQYIASHCERWNRRKILEHLCAKGIHAENCIDYYLEQYQYDEEALLVREMNKYIRNKNLSDGRIREKVIAYFLQKGYSYTIIQTILKEKIVVYKEEVMENE